MQALNENVIAHAAMQWQVTGKLGNTVEIDGGCPMNALTKLRVSLGKRSLGEFVDQARCKYFTEWRRQQNPMIVCFDQAKVEMHHRGTRDDLFAIWQCFDRNQYEIPRQTAISPDHRQAVDAEYQRIIRQGKTPLIVDCGANIGAGSLWLSMRYPLSTIIAVEPAPANLSVLRTNSKDKNICVVPGAISRDDGRIRFVDTGSALSNHMASNHDERGGYEVNAMCIETLCRHAPDRAEPFLLKMDIEGAEAVVFGENHEAFDRFPLIIIEPHDFMMPGQAVASKFLAFHAANKRDFLFWEENIFSISNSVFRKAAA